MNAPIRALKGLLLTTALLLPLSAVHAQEISLPQTHVRFSVDKVLEGQHVRIYATAVNSSNVDVVGVIKFEEIGKGKVGKDEPISIVAKKTDTVFGDWTPQSPGEKKIKVTLTPWDKGSDNPSNNTVTKTVTVHPDADRDGIADAQDPDDDNDGTLDKDDAFPFNPKEQKDTDKDGIGNNQDDDDDNDGTKDKDDAFPENDKEISDNDKDEIGDNEDDDDDNDGISDEEEEERGTDPLQDDTDKDGVNDAKDVFPLDPKEQKDFDKDGIGDNSDEDDDNDKVIDSEDYNPFNKGPVISPPFSETTAYVDKPLVLALPEIHDEDGNITKVEWITPEGEKSTDKEYKKTFKKAGKYEIIVKAYDDKNEYRTAVFQVNVLQPSLFGNFAWMLLIILLALAIAFYYIRKAQNRRGTQKIN